MRPGRFSLALALSLALAQGCDRRVEPYVPGEEPKAPDLSKIFPRGAEQAREEESAATPAGGRAGPMGAPPPAAPDASEAASAPAGPPIQGTVLLSPDLAARAPKDAVLFVIARRGAAGPPTAVKRIASPSFPLAFELGPGDRMIEAMPWSGPLTLTARLDADGNATTRTPGDVQGTARAAASPGDRDVSIVLDEAL